MKSRSKWKYFMKQTGERAYMIMKAFRIEEYVVTLLLELVII